MKNTLALEVGRIKGKGELGLENYAGDLFNSGATVFATLITTTIGVMTVIAIIWLLFKILIGAIAIISSGGDKAKVTEGKNNITYGLTGFVIVVSATFLISFIGYIVGIDFLNLISLITGLATP